jgi:N utilization substance protein B
MRKRSKAREYALQILYQVDVTRSDAQVIMQDFWEAHPAPQDVRAFATQVVTGTVEHLGQINQLIAQHANNWDITRMAIVDRNILRMGAFELLYLDDVPPKVCLNEAVELAKRFGDEESSKFVNGILDTIHKTHGRTESAAPGAPAA